MKIALLKDIKGLGKKNDIKDVADGYALNSLIPTKSAIVATPDVLKKIEVVKKQEAMQKKIQEDLLAKNIHSIHDAEVVVVRDANEKGHLFAGLHKEDIAKLVHDETEVDILPEFIQLEKPIKEIGEHKIDIKVQGKSATFILNVKAKK
ncbi:MAG TPA: 50S ribosomal protein L9 [Candidatus Paceibacterota bacterium]|nr:50S ribosomal protein L9 [Candidatus Paceibacterota bacterium]